MGVQLKVKIMRNPLGTPLWAVDMDKTSSSQDSREQIIANRDLALIRDKEVFLRRPQANRWVRFNRISWLKLLRVN